ncbi:hypothetical protein V1L54_09620 [Streptomyces sp. TRM 70361]|uniref:hypothetical protein n=1 Tax=Streptomyces sp. TRM 70361 TaxID=3116553 RepID=UPI002E7B7008|nr:hypothetical protein [Streptomyces sp. TRM 70361]MEE1939669.1 hypothetical protein [Streptomyces sp. TRM 70361]
MSVSTLAPETAAHTHRITSRAVEAARTRIDRGLVRYDGWFLVLIAVILALGATLLAGMAVWCVVNQGKTFTGSWEYRDFGLRVYFECR